jgi:AcrR family transcriptional regulator
LTKLRNKTATLERVLQAAIGEFSQRGFHGARVADIAAAARCSTETIYDVYLNKEGLFGAAASEVARAAFGTAGNQNDVKAALDVLPCPVARAVRAVEAYAIGQHSDAFAGLFFQVLTNPAHVPAGLVTEVFSQWESYTTYGGVALRAACAEGLAQVEDPTAAAKLIMKSVGIVDKGYGLFFGAHWPESAPFDMARSAIGVFLTPAGRERLASLKGT